MHKIDFFVHPEHGHIDYGGHPDQVEYKRYIECLLDEAEVSEYPVLVTGNFSTGIFEEIIPEERRVRSDSGYFSVSGQKFPRDRGEVHRDDWERFVRLIPDEYDDMRVHGAYFGGCPEGFAVQLFAYIWRGEHWHDWVTEEGNNIFGQKVNESKLRKFHELNGDFRKSKIRYGTVLHLPTLQPIDGCSGVIKPIEGLPHGNIAYQLLDSGSRIFSVRKPEERNILGNICSSSMDFQ